MTLAAKTKETLCKSVNIAIVQIPEQMFHTKLIPELNVALFL